MVGRHTLLHVFPGFGPGGTQLRMVSIMNALGDAFRHQIVSLDGIVDATDALGADVHVELKAAPSPGGFLARLWSFRKMVEDLRPDLVLTYNWGAIEAVAGARIADRCAIIHNECGFGPDEAFVLKRRRVWLRRLLLKGLFRTVVTSHAMLKIARFRYRLPAHKVQLIPTGVDVGTYKPGHNAAGRLAIGAGEDTVVFGYHGGLRSEKHLPMLLRAFHEARIPGSKLMLVGSGPCREELRDLAGKLQIANSVLFVGHAADPLPYLHMFDVFAMSSATEQVSNAMLEAMACGLPVLCTDVGDSRELLGPEGEFCVVTPGDVCGMASRMRQIAGSPDQRSASGSANRTRCIARYSREAMVSGYSALFHSAVARP
jgi:glycosyltransferase involved in cell wall biosynthesis